MTTVSTLSARGVAQEAFALTPGDIKRATWLCFFAWTFAVYDFVLFGNLLPVIAEDLGWQDATSTAVNTWVTAGTALVAFTIGPIADKLGRRKGILIAVSGAALASLLTATVGWVSAIGAVLGMVFLVLVRSLAGLGYAEQAVNAAYLNEMFAVHYKHPSSAKKRGFIYSLVQSGYPIGSVIAALSVYVILPVASWEWAFVVAVVPSIFVLIFGRKLKESPAFVMNHELQKLVDAGHTEEARELAAEYGVAMPNTGSSSLREVFRGESLRSVVFIGGGFMLIWLGVLAFTILGTTMLTAEDGKNIEFDNAIVVLMISNGGAFLGYLFHGWLGDRIGRRNTIAIGWILCAIFFTAMLYAPDGNFPVIVTLYSLGLFFMLGPFSALLFFTGESFPGHTRATGAALINAGGQVGAIIAGALITMSLNAGAGWINAALWWGSIPVLIGGLMVFGARNIKPGEIRND